MEIKLNKRTWGVLAFSPFFFLLLLMLVLVPASAHYRFVTRSYGLNCFDWSYMILGNLFIYGLVYFFIKKCTDFKNLPADKKSEWVRFLIIFHIIALPVFWYKYIRKKTNEY